MRSSVFFILFFLLLTHAAMAQFPQEEWSIRYGNITASAQPTLQPLPTSDGGFLIISSEYSISGNNPAPRGDYDLVLTKTNSTGFIQWQKVYGGSASDYSPSMNFLKANDGGYLITGNSRSVDGDLPATNDPDKGNLWILKIDEDGNILFSKIINSAYDTYEYILSIIPANDGNGYIGILDLNDNAPGTHPDGFFSNCTGGTKTAKLIKLSNAGDVTYQKCLATDYGCCGDGFSITNGPNRKYLLSVTGRGLANCSVTRMASLSMIDDTLHYFWQKTTDQYALSSGFYSAGWPKFEVLVKDNNFIIPLRDNTSSGCLSTSPLVLLCIDTLGNQVWKNTIPNIRSSVMVSPVDAGDNNSFYIMQNAGILNNFDDTSFICKFSYSGTLLAKKQLSIYKYNLRLLDYRAIELFKVGSTFYFCGTNTWHNYTPPFFYSSTKPMFGKLGPINTVAGYAFLDTNHNNIKDAGESFIRGLEVLGRKSNGHFMMDVTDSGGRYRMVADTGLYNYTVSAQGIGNFTVLPAAASTNHSSYLFADTINFALTAIPGKYDLSVNLIPVSTVIPGGQSTYQLRCRNNSAVPLNAKLKFIKMPAMTLNSTSKPYSSLVADTITWNYTNLAPLKTDTINLTFDIPVSPVVNVNDTFNLLAFVSIDSVQTDSTNDSIRVKQVVRSNYISNDKTEKNAGHFSLVQLTNGDRLEYTIHFQNTGTFPVTTVIVRDTLDARLDWSTLEITGSSYAVDFMLHDENKAEWKFDNINLPAATSPDDAASSGFITYSIKPRSTIQEGEIINNKASIYFDYNLPTTTAEVETLIYNSNPIARNFTFTGNGNWTNAANWLGGIVPPSTLLSGDHVIINGSCILNTVVHANAGSSVVVATGKSLLVQGNLIVQ
ncbi:MAG: hypothetical protein QM737_12980 [Ferruginibacter sp.]